MLGYKHMEQSDKVQCLAEIEAILKKYQMTLNVYPTYKLELASRPGLEDKTNGEPKI